MGPSRRRHPLRRRCKSFISISVRMPKRPAEKPPLPPSAGNVVRTSPAIRPMRPHAHTNSINMTSEPVLLRASGGAGPIPIVETRSFCVGEARRLGKEKLLEVRRCCMDDVFFEGQPGKRWPESSPFACWWCAHGFDGPPMGIPTQHDSRLDRYVLSGNFCSANCARAYIEKSSPNMLKPFRLGQLQNLLQKALGVAWREVRPAPPPHCLQMFGGWMTIEEFRGQRFIFARDARKDELIERWEPQEVAITLWGKSVSLRGVSADQLRQQVDRRALVPPVQAMERRAGGAAGKGLEAFINFKRRKV